MRKEMMLLGLPAELNAVRPISTPETCVGISETNRWPHALSTSVSVYNRPHPICHLLLCSPYVIAFQPGVRRENVSEIRQGNLLTILLWYDITL